MNHQSSLAISVAKTTAVTTLLLLIPFTAQLLTDEVAWTLSDFVFAGILIFGTGTAYILISRQSDSLMYRAAFGVLLFAALFLIWVNLAAGIIGSEDNPANLMYGGVLAILAIGVIAARFRSHGMAYALFTTSIAHAFIIFVSLSYGMQNLTRSSVTEIVLFNGLFIVQFTLSGSLFWQVSKDAHHNAPQLVQF